MKGLNLTILLILLFFSLAHKLHSQVINTLKCDSTNRFPITQFTNVLRTTQLISVDSAILLDKENKFFRAPDKPVLVYNYDPYFYWFRFVVRNDRSTPIDLMLLMAPIGLKEGLLYQKDSTGWKERVRTGMRLRFEDRPYPYAHNVFPVTIPPNTTDTLYLSADASNVYKSFGFALIKPKALQIFENRTYYIFGIIVGLLLLFLIFNLYLYFTLREEVHLWYALYIGLLFLIEMKNDHLDQQFLGWDSEAIYHMTPLMAFGAIALAVLMHVVQHFLTNIRKNEFMYRFSMVIKINVLLSGLSHWIFFYLQADSRILSFIFLWAEYSTLLSILVIIVACIYSLSKGFKGAIFILAGLIVFLFGASQRLLFPSTLSFLFPPSIFHIGMILETLIISFGLIYQYRKYKKEKEEVVKNIGSLLNDARYELMREISSEIHDNVLQILGIIKLNINQLLSKDSVKNNALANESATLLAKAIGELRHLSREGEGTLEKEGALQQAVLDDINSIERLGTYKILHRVTGSLERIPPAKRKHIYRIFQESLHNIMKHAQTATYILVDISCTDSFRLRVEDNGKGFDKETLETGPVSFGQGIGNMKKRADLIKADIQFQSSSSGTAVILEMELDEVPTRTYGVNGNG